MSIKIKELPLSERPYEKLEMYGEKLLSDSELLAIILKTGTKSETAVSLAQKVISYASQKNKNQIISNIQDVSLEELKSIKGIGRVKAIQIKAICELTKRMSKPINLRKVRIKQSQDVANLLMGELRNEKREILKVVILNTKNEVQKVQEVAQGSNSSISIMPKDILLETVRMQMSKIILVHNHPSGDPTPSVSDINITRRVEDAARLLGIELLDHIIIGDGKYQSIFKYKG